MAGKCIKDCLFERVFTLSESGTSQGAVIRSSPFSVKRSFSDGFCHYFDVFGCFLLLFTLHSVELTFPENLGLRVFPDSPDQDREVVKLKTNSLKNTSFCTKTG
jgi:hypothetical protein